MFTEWASGGWRMDRERQPVRDDDTVTVDHLLNFKPHQLVRFWSDFVAAAGNGIASEAARCPGNDWIGRGRADLEYITEGHYLAFLTAPVTVWESEIFRAATRGAQDLQVTRKDNDVRGLGTQCWVFRNPMRLGDCLADSGLPPGEGFAIGLTVLPSGETKCSHPVSTIGICPTPLNEPHQNRCPILRITSVIFSTNTAQSGNDVWAASQFLKTKVARREILDPPHTTKAAARRRKKSGVALREVAQVRLLRRLEEPEAHEDGCSAARDWSCRWLVGAHWRNQFLPSRGDHEPRYIAPYVKGPADKPLRVRGRSVSAASR